MINQLSNFYSGKKILITGHTGFKGSWLSQVLLNLGAKILGISLDPSKPSLFYDLHLSSRLEDNRINILDLNKCNDTISKFKPEIIFHLAAQPLVNFSYENPLLTHSTNYIGTANILSLFSKYDFFKAGVFITTDKVYKNEEKGLPFKETDPFGGYDPYSASKAASEILIESWRNSFIDTSKKGIASARAGNVIGGGDWALDRIIPDFFKAYLNQTPLNIRNPNSIRPWQHVLDPIFGYLILGMKLFTNPNKYSEGWNFGPNNNDLITVKQLIDLILTKVNFDKNLLINSTANFHEAKILTLSNDKAIHKLGWNPILDSKESIEMTINWYLNYNSGNLIDFTNQQIDYYFSKVMNKV
jgi:CDP-glucose 4,6-dehydratase